MLEIKEAISAACKNLFNTDIEPELSRPDEQFGDYSTNVALQLAGQLNKNPREVAEALAGSLKEVTQVAKIEIAGPGFINFTLTDSTLAAAALRATQLNKPLDGQEILAEFGDPNPFKEMHIGHVYSAIVGDSISRLLEHNGAKVHRLSYHGDVGLHVAQAVWAIGKKVNWQPEQLRELVSRRETREDWPTFTIGELYAEGAKAYEDNKEISSDIDEINKYIYEGKNPVVEPIYKWGLHESLTHFFTLFKRVLFINYEKHYLESEATKVGTETVMDHLGPVFTKSEGAIIYEGEKKGLHTRVFITSKGLPTYEAKDLGLAFLKNRDYPAANKSIIITAHEQSDYFKVMLAALSEINERLAASTTHLPHGFVSLNTGKMSSRSGNVYSAIDLFKRVQKSTEAHFPDIEDKTDVWLTAEAAIKYEFLKYRLGSDIVYDIDQSVSMEGNSGPYIQYAHARARSILAKAGFDMPYRIDEHGVEREKPLEIGKEDLPLLGGERPLARKISEYPDVITKAGAELLPSHVTSYLYELAQTFNRFYEGNRVIGDSRQQIRLNLVRAYADVLKSGLNVLGINAPERM